MTIAQIAADVGRTAIRQTNLAVSVSEKNIEISVHGNLGFNCWKALSQARKIAQREKLPLRVEVGRCQHANMAGIGALLIAIDKLGDIEIAGCTEQSRHWFSNLGVCSGCRNNKSASACPKPLQC